MKLFGWHFAVFYSTDLNPFRFQRSPLSLPLVLPSLSIGWKITLTSPGGRSYRRLSWLDDSLWQPLVTFVPLLRPFVNSHRIQVWFFFLRVSSLLFVLVNYWVLSLSVRSHFADSQHWKSRVQFAQKSPRDCSAKTTAGEHTHTYRQTHTQAHACTDRCTYRVRPCLLRPQEK